MLRSAALALLAVAAAATAADEGPSLVPPPQPTVERVGAVDPAAAPSAAGSDAPAGSRAPRDAGALPLLAPVWLDVLANEVPRGTFLVQLSGADVWIAVEDLEGMGLSVPAGDRIDVGGRSLVSLSSLSGLLTFRVDEQALALRITANQAILGRTRLDLARLKPPPGMLRRTQATSAYLNWAVAADTEDHRSASSEAGVAVGRALLVAGGSADEARGAVRGMTTLYLDDERRLVRWTAGDLVTQASDPLGGTALVGGLSVGRNFGLDPYLSLAPYPRSSVFSPTPATLEVWVDDTLVRRQALQPGTVDLENIPVNAGLSHVRTVLRDAFGREQSASTFALFGSSLLAPGIVDWSAAAGFRREGFGAESFSYASTPAGQARLRAGLTPRLTAGARLEAADGLVSGGASLAMAVPYGELETAAGASRAGAEGGAAATVTWRAYAHRASGVAQLRWDSGRYASLSLSPQPDRAVLRGALSGSVSIVRSLTLLGELAASRFREGGDGVRGLVRLWWSHRTGTAASLSVSRSLNAALPDVTEVLLSVSAPLPGRTTVEVSGATGTRTAGEYGQFTATRSLASGPDVGYRVAARTGDGAIAQADAQAQNRFARAEVNHVQLDPWTGARHALTTGRFASGFVLVDGRLFPTRPVEGSFALVRAEAPDVTVLHEGRPVGRTDAHGELLVTNLLPYYGNRLGLRDTDFPLEYRIDEVERIVAPRDRGGTVERFRVARVTAVTGRLRLVLDGGEAAPEWGDVAVELPGRRAVSPVGEGGLFWLEGIPAGTHEALLRWEGRLCRFTFLVPDGAGATVDLGPVRCSQLL